METKLRIKVKDTSEIREWFDFDEVVYVKYYEKVGENIYDVIVRTAGCDLNFRGVTTLQKIKEAVVKKSQYYPLKSRVTFVDGTERIIYSRNEYWERSNAEYFANIKLTKVVSIERM